MRAFVVTGPGHAEVKDVAPPIADAGQVVVDVERVGVCGTDVEIFTGHMAYLRTGAASYPIRPGHEWCGTVASLGPGVDPAWLGHRVTGDTMLGCGRCERCRGGRQHVCAQRYEIGIRGGWHGALAEQLLVPASALHGLPDAVGVAAGAMVEPGGNALRAVRAAALGPGARLLVWGPGTIGLLALRFGLVAGAEVHVVGRDGPALGLARELGAHGAWRREDLPDLAYDATIDATNDPGVPAMALDRVEPGGRLVLIGISAEASLLDSRVLVLADVTAVGVLSGSAGLSGAIEQYADGRVDPEPLVAATVGLDRVADVLGGWRPAGAGARPKVLVDLRS